MVGLSRQKATIGMPMRCSGGKGSGKAARSAKAADAQTAKAKGADGHAGKAKDHEAVSAPGHRRTSPVSPLRANGSAKVRDPPPHLLPQLHEYNAPFFFSLRLRSILAGFPTPSKWALINVGANGLAGAKDSCANGRPVSPTGGSGGPGGHFSLLLQSAKMLKRSAAFVPSG